jgi:hypothetical protein
MIDTILVGAGFIFLIYIIIKSRKSMKEIEVSKRNIEFIFTNKKLLTSSVSNLN